MKDQIPTLTAAMKMIAEIRDTYQQRFPTSRVPQELRDVEEQLSTIRDIMNF